MPLITQTAVPAITPRRTPQIMQWVLLALLPGLAAQTFFFGWGAVINGLWGSFTALGCEALVLTLRRRPLRGYLTDGSALVTAWLLALALPPLSPWWLTLVGTAFAVVVGKQLYGGLGHNPFNPAMVGYVFLLISFPQAMTGWLPPRGIAGSLADHGLISGFIDALATIFPWGPAGSGVNVDGISSTTPLDIVRQNRSHTLTELWASTPLLQAFAGRGWLWVNLGYLLGGLGLLYRRVFTWHAPVGMLTALTVMAALFINGDGAGSHGGVLFHLFSGATMLGAFFIITDPVSGATSNQGRLLFGVGVGVLVYIIRAWGGYPDGVAFATLLMNLAAPVIDYYTPPRTYGHTKPRAGLPPSR